MREPSADGSGVGSGRVVVPSFAATAPCPANISLRALGIFEQAGGAEPAGRHPGLVSGASHETSGARAPASVAFTATMRDLTQREKFIIGGTGAMAVLTFFPWLSVSFEGEGMGELFKQLGAAPGNANGFSSTEGVIAFLGAVATVGLVLADRAGALVLPARTLLLVPLVTTGVSALCLVIFLGRSGGGTTGPVSVGRSFWFYIAVLALCFATFHAFQRFVEGSKGAPTKPFSGSPPASPPPASPPPAAR